MNKGRWAVRYRFRASGSIVEPYWDRCLCSRRFESLEMCNVFCSGLNHRSMYANLRKGFYIPFDTEKINRLNSWFRGEECNEH